MPAEVDRKASGVLEREMSPAGEISETVKVAFFAGWSKHGCGKHGQRE